MSITLLSRILLFFFFTLLYYNLLITKIPTINYYALFFFEKTNFFVTYNLSLINYNMLLYGFTLLFLKIFPKTKNISNFFKLTYMNIKYYILLFFGSIYYYYLTIILLNYETTWKYCEILDKFMPFNLFKQTFCILFFSLIIFILLLHFFEKFVLIYFDGFIVFFFLLLISNISLITNIFTVILTVAVTYILSNYFNSKNFIIYNKRTHDFNYLNYMSSTEFFPNYIFIFWFLNIFIFFINSNLNNLVIFNNILFFFNKYNNLFEIILLFCILVILFILNFIIFQILLNPNFYFIKNFKYSENYLLNVFINNYNLVYLYIITNNLKNYLIIFLILFLIFLQLPIKDNLHIYLTITHTFFIFVTLKRIIIEFQTKLIK